MTISGAWENAIDFDIVTAALVISPGTRSLPGIPGVTGRRCDNLAAWISKAMWRSRTPATIG